MSGRDRWPIAPLCEAAKGDVGLDHAEVQSWTRHVGAGPAHRVAGGSHCHRDVQKTSIILPAGQQFASVQGPLGPWLPFRVPAIRH